MSVNKEFRNSKVTGVTEVAKYFSPILNFFPDKKRVVWKPVLFRGLEKIPHHPEMDNRIQLPTTSGLTVTGDKLYPCLL